MKITHYLIFLLFVGIAFTLNAQTVPAWAVGTWADGDHIITISKIGSYHDSDGYTYDDAIIDGNTVRYAKRTVKITKTNNPNQIKMSVSADGRTNWLEWTYTKVGTTVTPAPAQTTPNTTSTTNKSSSALTVPNWAIGKWKTGNATKNITSTQMLSGDCKYDITKIDPDGTIWFKFAGYHNIKVQKTASANQIRVLVGLGDSTTDFPGEYVYTKVP